MPAEACRGLPAGGAGDNPHAAPDTERGAIRLKSNVLPVRLRGRPCNAFPALVSDSFRFLQLRYPTSRILPFFPEERGSGLFGADKKYGDPSQEGTVMQTYYKNFVDRMVSPSMEKKLRLGRRGGEERRQMDDRRIHTDDGYQTSDRERRDPDINRRSLIERRQRWFRTSQYQSRHV